MEERSIHEKKLYRSRRNRVVGGVCGGLGEYFEVDPVLIRVLSIVGAFITSGLLLFGYVIAWIIIPEKVEPYVFENVSSSEGGEGTPSMPYEQTNSKGKTTLGIILIVLGAMLLADNIFPLFRFWDYWPVLLIGAGVLLVTNSFTNK